MVEGEASAGAYSVYGFSGGELNLFDEVFVGGLGEAFAFFLVEVDVVYPESGVEGRFGYPGEGRASSVLRYGQVLELNEFEVDADFVVLEGNERDAKTIVSAVEELERDVEGVGRVRGGKVGVFGDVTYHAGIATFLAYFVGEVIPDVEPVTVLFVDLGSTDFEVVVIDDGVTYFGYPSPLGGSGIASTEGGAEVHFSNDVGVTG